MMAPSPRREGTTPAEVEIVVVEDNPNDAELILRVFRKHNMANQIVLLQDGAETLDFFFPRDGAAPPSAALRVVLLDLKLPTVDGIEVLRRLKSDGRTWSIPVVVVTSSSEDRDIKDAYALGVNSYVTKPIKFDEFAKAVADLGLYWLMLNKLPAQ
ncbi:MAG: response regulator [Planctomycetes bacterium]|nr:response regulator [Planctomycetota bacterium]